MRLYFEGELDDSLADHPRGLRQARDASSTGSNGRLSFFLVTAVDYTVTRRLNFGAE